MSAERIDCLFDYAVSHPEGFTYKDVESDLGWPRHEFSHVRSQLRRMLSADDTIFLVCEPQGKAAPWSYKLIGTYEDGKSWAAIRLRDCETRLMTIQGMSSVVVRASDGRSLDGKRARLIDRSLRRLGEDLVDIVSNDGLF